MSEKFLFYGHARKKQGWMFSNFSSHPVIAYDVEWPTSEHLFQALKFQPTDEEYYIEISKAASPMIAKRMGQTRNHPLRSDWEDIKDEVMYLCVHNKVVQNSDVRKALLDTEDMELVENSPRDYYWGCGASGTGRNQLGKTLMVIRDTLIRL